MSPLLGNYQNEAVRSDLKFAIWIDILQIEIPVF